MTRRATGLVMVVVGLFLGGCQSPPGRTFSVRSNEITNVTGRKPKLRSGCLPAPMPKTRYLLLPQTEVLDPKDIGKHSYSSTTETEGNGVVYTTRAGIIDIHHVRVAADWTAYLSAKTYESLSQGTDKFTFTTTPTHLTAYHVSIAYPENWRDMDPREKDEICYDLSIRLGQYLTHRSGIWHEILTWFGYKARGFMPDFASAFSWEDPISDLVGVIIGGRAFREMNDTGQTFDETVTRLLNEELAHLDVQPVETTRDVLKRLDGTWYTTGKIPVPVIMKRNFDVGLDDGYITPLIPFTAGALPGPLTEYRAPSGEVLSVYGFTIEVKLRPHEFEKGRILKLVGAKKYVIPEEHFPIIIAHIRELGVEMYGEKVDSP